MLDERAAASCASKRMAAPRFSSGNKWP